MPLLNTKGNVKGVAAKPAAASSSSADKSSGSKSGSSKAKPKSDKPKGEKKQKKDTGPVKPKAAFNMWMADNKEKFKGENPEVKGLDISRQMREQWKDGVDEATKQKYESKAKRELDNWKVEKKKWEKDNPERMAEIAEEKQEKKKKRDANPKASKPKGGKKKKRSSEDEDETSEDEQPKAKKQKSSDPDPDKPKKPLTSFMRFSNDKRKETGLKGKDAASKLGEMWRELKDAEKEPYVAAYNAEMVGYKKRLAEYKNLSEDDKGESEEAHENGKENGESAPAPAAAKNGDKAGSGDEAPAAADAGDANGEAAEAKNDAE